MACKAGSDHKWRYTFFLTTLISKRCLYCGRSTYASDLTDPPPKTRTKRNGFVIGVKSQATDVGFREAKS